MNPDSASLLASSPEIHEYIKGSPAAIDEIRSGLSPNATYGNGLPSTYYGWKLTVDNTVILPTRKGVNQAAGKTWAFPYQTVAVVSRLGDLEGVWGGQAFTTLSMFWFKDEMTVESRSDAWDRRMQNRVMQQITPILTSPLSGWLITSAFSKNTL
jgi:hypothetical protein